MAAGKAVLKLYFSNVLQEPKKSCVFACCQFFPQFIVGGNPRMDEAFPVFVAFWR